MKKFLRVFFRIALPVLALTCLLFIFSNSLKTAKNSGGESGVVVTALRESAKTVLHHEIRISEFHNAVRKRAHIVEFALYAFFLSAAAMQRRKTIRGVFSGVLLASLFSGVTDEYLQTFFDGRSPSVSDVMIDLAGAITGFAVAYGIGFFALRRLEKKKSAGLSAPPAADPGEQPKEK